VRIIDQPLPADRRTRLLEVDAHRDAQIPREPVDLAAEPLGVVTRSVDVVDAARPDHDQQAIVGRVQDRLHLAAAAHQYVDVDVGQRQLADQLARGGQRDQAVDPLVADGIASLGAGERHVSRRSRRRC
jgi:hypothetical protein